MIKINFRKFPILFISSGIFFFVISKLVFPPNIYNTPVGIDFYNYYAFSQSKFSLNEITFPRPIFWVYLRLIGIFHNTSIFFTLLALPAFIFISFTFSFLVKNAFIRPTFSNFLIFNTLLFLSPKFFIHFKADPGAMFAGVFALMALETMSKIHLSNSKIDLRIFLRLLLLTWLSMESKPQFSAVLILISFIAVIKRPKIAQAAILFVVTMIPILVVLKDKILDSPFLANSNSNSPYAVVLDPRSIFRVMAYYLENTFTLGLLAIFFLTVLFQIYSKKYLEIVWMLGILLAVLIPLTLIPNHVLPPYAWFGTFVISIWVTINFDFAINQINSDWKRRSLTMLVLLSVFLVSKDVPNTRYIDFSSGKIESDTLVKWVLDRQIENKNLEETAKTLESKGINNVLLGGVYGPYHLFRNSLYVKSVYKNIGTYYVYLQNSESIWNSVARDMRTGVNLNDLPELTIDWIVLVNQHGSVTHILSYKEFLRYDSNVRIAALDTGFLFKPDLEGYKQYSDNRTTIKFLMKMNNHQKYFDAIDELYRPFTSIHS